jgi:APA family basic amino acid/polyamine antiporter
MSAAGLENVGQSPAHGLDTEFHRGLGLFDSTMVVVGSMIGSGIFLVSAEMSRFIGSPGWLLVAWLVTGVLTVAGALTYGELAAMMPRAGGQYVYLCEGLSPFWGFLYGWTLFLVIQTGTIAAVGVGFAKFLGIFWPVIAEQNYLVAPIHLGDHYAISLSTAQLVGVLLIVFLTWTNTRGLEYGKIIQNIFTVSKSAALLGLIAIGLTLGWNADAVAANFGAFWDRTGVQPVSPGIDLTAVTSFGLFVAICVSQTGSLFSADAWNNITFTAGEVREPRRNIPLSLALGTGLVILLYLLANVAYLVGLPLHGTKEAATIAGRGIQYATNDRVATALVESIFGSRGAAIMAAVIMVSTFGCNNGLILAGARAYYAMARDRLFFAWVGRLNAAKVPAGGLVLQGVWSALLILPRVITGRDEGTGEAKYGPLYNNLLDYVISAALIFYILTIVSVFRLRRSQPDTPRPYRAVGYPVVPALYIVGAAAILLVLFVYRSSTTWPGLVIVALGIPVYFAWRQSAKSQSGATSAGAP